MKLYYAAASPFVRKVLVVVHETGQIDDIALVTTSLSPVAPSDAVRAANPLSKIPALERAEGPALYDSRVICAYLDAKVGGGLYVSEADRWDVMTLEATGDGLMDAAVALRYETFLRPSDKQWEDWADGQWAKVSAALHALEGRWMAHLAKPVTMGHISVACGLGYLDFRHAERTWRSKTPALAEWYAGFETRPSMVATAPH